MWERSETSEDVAMFGQMVKKYHGFKVGWEDRGASVRSEKQGTDWCAQEILGGGCEAERNEIDC